MDESSYSSIIPVGGVYHKIKESVTKIPAGGVYRKIKESVTKINWAPGEFERVFGGQRKQSAKDEMGSKQVQVESRKESLYSRFINLGPMPEINYVQDHQWREVFLGGPTVNAAGNQGNDFPGFYYYDPHAKHEWVVMIKGVIDWRVTKYLRRCNHGHLEIGVSSIKSIANSVQFEVWHQARSSPPTQWEALKTLVDLSFQLLPLPTPQQAEPNWANIAHKCLVALETKRLQMTVGGVTGYGSIVEDLNVVRSARGHQLELLSNVGIAYSLLEAADIPGLHTGRTIADRLILDVIPAFFNKKLDIFVNSLYRDSSSHSGEVILETWYLLSNLEKILGIVELTRNSILEKYAYTCLSWVIKLARELDYVFPLFLNIKSRDDYGQLLNPSVLGIYALICARAANIFSDKRETLIGEAVRGLRLLHRFRIEQIHHEPFQLAMAASAASLIGKMIKDDNLRQWRLDFARATLLSMYRSPQYAGLFQGCAGLSYPAFRESVATLDALSFLLKEDDLHFRDILSLAFRNTLPFFERSGQIHELPFEGLPTKEIPEAKNSGTAIYAASQVFDLARLQVAIRGQDIVEKSSRRHRQRRDHFKS